MPQISSHRYPDRKPGCSVSPHRRPVAGQEAQRSVPHPGVGPGTNFQDRKENPGDWVEALNYPVAVPVQAGVTVNLTPPPTPPPP